MNQDKSTTKTVKTSQILQTMQQRADRKFKMHQIWEKEHKWKKDCVFNVEIKLL